jgi:hypothetical protein
VTPSTTETRFRKLLVTTCALTAVLIYLVWWQTYADVHLGDHYTQLPPGQPAMAQGSPIRLLALTRTELLAGSPGTDPQVAVTGATWVVADLEVTVRGDPTNFLCDVQLLGLTMRTWKETNPSVQRSTTFCNNDDIVPGRPYRFETVFLVPTSDAGQLAGVALTDRSVTGPTQVLTPPR